MIRFNGVRFDNFNGLIYCCFCIRFIFSVFGFYFDTYLITGFKTAAYLVKIILIV